MTVILLLGITMALVGIGLATWAARHYRRNGAQFTDASKRWNKTKATVLDARLVERERTDSNDNSNTVYEPRLRYSYTVGTDVREGDRINLCAGLCFYDPGRAKQWLAAHVTGATIELWYDPLEPANSACTLDKPNLLGAIFTGAAGLSVTAIGIWMFFNIH